MFRQIFVFLSLNWIIVLYFFLQVQQPYDPTPFYSQFYRSGADTDGRISPFHSTGVATKYNGNLAVVSPQISQSAQEVLSNENSKWNIPEFPGEKEKPLTIWL